MSYRCLKDAFIDHPRGKLEGFPYLFRHVSVFSLLECHLVIKRYVNINSQIKYRFYLLSICTKHAAYKRLHSSLLSGQIMTDLADKAKRETDNEIMRCHIAVLSR